MVIDLGEDGTSEPKVTREDIQQITTGTSSLDNTLTYFFPAVKQTA